MELLYLWIQDFKNIKNCGFNFSSRYITEYKPDTKELLLKENTEHIPDFFGNHISEITVIVGKNGSGKSSLLEFIMHIYIVDDTISPFIAFFKVDNDLIILKHKLEVDKRPRQTQLVTFEESDLLPFQNFKSVYYTDVFTGEFKNFQLNRDRMSSYIDLSTHFFVDPFRRIPELHEEQSKKQVEKYQTGQNGIMGQYILNRGIDSLKFPLGDTSFVMELDTRLSRNGVIRFIAEQYGKDENRDFLNNEQFQKKLIEIDSRFPNSTFSDKLIRSFFWAKSIDFIIRFGSSFYSKIDSVDLDSTNLSSADLAKLLNLHEYDDRNVDELLELIQNTSQFNEKTEKLIIVRPENSFLSLVGKIKSITGMLYQYGIDFLRVYFKYQGQNQELSDSSGFSSGELSSWRFKARLDSVDGLAKTQICLLVIDEGETFLHPEWQREYIYDLINDVKRLIKTGVTQDMHFSIWPILEKRPLRPGRKSCT